MNISDVIYLYIKKLKTCDVGKAIMFWLLSFWYHSSSCYRLMKMMIIMIVVVVSMNVIVVMKHVMVLRCSKEGST